MIAYVHFSKESPSKPVWQTTDCVKEKQTLTAFVSTRHWKFSLLHSKRHTKSKII